VRPGPVFYAETRRFPANFAEINRLIWHTYPTPDYGSEGRRAWTKNYFYLYTKVNDETCAFWALPVGARREYASSFFVVVSTNWLRIWKGKAMSDGEIVVVPNIPSPQVLSESGFTELKQPII
jgi:hypothetical protein